MSKKKVLLTFMSALLIQSTASAGVTERVYEAVLECVYVTCPAFILRVTGIDYLLKNIERNKKAKAIVAATDDALFFKTHVLKATAGESADNIYSKIVIQIAPGDRLTQVTRIKYLAADGSSYSRLEEVVLDVDANQPIELENTNVAGVKINGRELISLKLQRAHLATQFLIFSEALHVTDTQRSRFAIATDAVALNEIAIMFAHKKN